MTHEEKLDKLLETSATKLRQHYRALESFTNKRNLGKTTALAKFEKTADDWKKAHKEYEDFDKNMKENKIDPKSKFIKK